MFAESDMHMLLAKPTSTSRFNGISLAQKRRSIRDGSQQNAGEQIGPKNSRNKNVKCRVSGTHRFRGSLSGTERPREKHTD